MDEKGNVFIFLLSHRVHASLPFSTAYCIYIFVSIGNRICVLRQIKSALDVFPLSFFFHISIRKVVGESKDTAMCITILDLFLRHFQCEHLKQIISWACYPKQIQFQICDTQMELNGMEWSAFLLQTMSITWFRRLCSH